MTKIKAGNIYMCLKDISVYDSFTKGKIYSSIYDNALINDNHIEVKVMNSEYFRIASDKEIFKAELDCLKKETSIGLSEWENGVEHGRMEVINTLYRLLDSMQEEPVSEDLEKAAIEYWKQAIREGKDTKMDAFSAGAKWQLNKFKKI